jgi:hypothetical protein
VHPELVGEPGVRQLGDHHPMPLYHPAVPAVAHALEGSEAIRPACERRAVPHEDRDSRHPEPANNQDTRSSSKASETLARLLE